MKQIETEVPRLSLPEWRARIGAGQIYGELGRVNVSEDGFVIRCQLCGAELNQITNTHARIHGLSVEEYRDLLGLNRTQCLSSPRLHNLRSKIFTRMQTARNLDGNRPTKRADLKPESGETRLQTLLNRQDKKLQTRKDNHFPRICPTKNGFFCLYGEKYYTSKAVEQVTVDLITNTEVAVSWIKDGQKYQRVYLRKDQH